MLEGQQPGIGSLEAALESVGETALASSSVAEMQRSRSPEDVINEIFLAARAPVFRYLLCLMGNASDAEDATQEVFLRLYEELSAHRRIGNLRSWLFRVAHNLAVDWRRSQERTACAPLLPQGLSENAIADRGVSAEQRLLAEERDARLTAVLRLLSVQERACLELRAEGLRYREIAEVLGVGLSTVQTFLDRALRKIERSIHG